MTKTRARGWWYPYIFVGAFGVVIAVNGTLAYFATSTFTGLETSDAYEKGRLYNRNLKLAQTQAALGWTVDTIVEPVQVAGQPGFDIRVTYNDKDGKPVQGLEVSADVIRPTTAGYDHQIQLAPLGVGAYGGAIPQAMNGVWDVDLVAVGDGVSYQHAKRIILP